MLAPVSHILPLTLIRRSRVLDVPARVTVRVGQKVNASDTIAEAAVPVKHVLLDLRRGLGISQLSAVEKCLVRHEGDLLGKGDVIAETGGVFSRIVRAPSDGELVAIVNGQALLRVQTSTLELKAGFSGIVSELLPERGAVIETTGALLQGVWGNGQIDSGLLVLVGKSSEEELTRAGLDVSLRGAVVLAGHCASADALQAAAELPLRGLILASMTAKLLPTAAKMAYPLVVMEGFGKHAMNDAAYRLLASSEKRDVSVNGRFNARAGEPPEIVIPLPATAELPRETDKFLPNQTVRVLGLPYQGQIGTLLQVRPGLSTMPSGLRVRAAEVLLPPDTRVMVPLANLMVIE